MFDRYRRIESDDEDECMESSFAQQMNEERISTKIGNFVFFILFLMSVTTSMTLCGLFILKFVASFKRNIGRSGTRTSDTPRGRRRKKKKNEKSQNTT